MKWPSRKILVIATIICSLVAVLTLAWLLGFLRSPNEPPIVKEIKAWFTVIWLFISVFFLTGIVLLLISLQIGYSADLLKMQIEKGADEAKERKHKLLTFASRFLREIGMAFLIACIITMTFEVTVRRQERTENERQAKLIQTDLFRFLLGHSVDQQLMNELYQGVFQSRFVRRKLEVAYELSPLEKQAKDEEKYIRVRTQVSFFLKNVTNDPQERTLKAFFVNVCQCDGHKDELVSLVVSDGEERLLEIGREPFLPLAGSLRSTLKSFPKTVVVQPGREVRMLVVYETVKRYADSVSFHTLDAADGISVRVALSDPELSKLAVHADSAHRNDPQLMSFRDDRSRLYEWRLDHYLLPGQGVELHWRPKQAGDNIKLPEGKKK